MQSCYFGDFVKDFDREFPVILYGIFFFYVVISKFYSSFHNKSAVYRKNNGRSRCLNIYIIVRHPSNFFNGFLKFRTVDNDWFSVVVFDVYVKILEILYFDE